MFVCIEGPDAAGKETQTRSLVMRLIQDGTPGRQFSFPRYETKLGKAISRHLKREIAVVGNPITVGKPSIAPEDAMIFQCMTTIDKYAAAEEIRRAAAHGHVVCDRYWQSALVYGAADGLPRDWLIAIHTSLPQADLNIFLDLPLEEALVRRPERRDRYEKDLEKQRAVRQGYRELWSAGGLPGLAGRWVTVDGHGTVDEVHERIWREVTKTQALARGFHEQRDGGAP